MSEDNAILSVAVNCKLTSDKLAGIVSFEFGEIIVITGFSVSFNLR